jgi:hypothetical protein
MESSEMLASFQEIEPNLKISYVDACGGGAVLWIRIIVVFLFPLQV